MTPRRWDAELERIGLVRARGKHSGTIRGVRVEACSGIICAARLTAAIDPPLDLGVNAMGQSQAHRWSNAGLIEAHLADEDSRVRELLGPDLRNAMGNVASSDGSAWSYRLTDRLFSIETPFDLRPGDIAARAQSTVGVVESVDWARSRIAPASALAAVWTNLRAVANAHGLDVTSAPCGLEGRVRGLHARIHSTRLARLRFGVAARVLFLEPLGVRFVRQVVDADVRRQVSAIGRRGLAVRMDHESVTATGGAFPVATQDALDRLLELVALAETLVHNAALARRGSRAPYR